MPDSHELALPRARAIALRNLPAGSSADIHVAGGYCAAHVAFVGYSRRTGTATYALRFVNQTSLNLSAQTFCVTRRGDAIPAYPLAIEIAPFSVKDTLVPVRVADVGPYDRALVRVNGKGISFSVDAPGPVAALSPRTRFFRWGAVAAFATAAIALAAAAATPRLPVFAAPSRALAGQTIDIPFVRDGLGSLHYAFAAADGRQISAGIARERQGVLHFALPNATISLPYVVHVYARGPLGSVQRSATIVAVVPRQAATPKVLARSIGTMPAVTIQSLSVTPAPVRVGEPLKVSYVTNASAGDVRLIDAAGRSWSAGPLRAAGSTWLHVPPETAGREMRVVLQARGVRGDAISTVGVMVLSGGDAKAAVASIGRANAQPASAPAIVLSKETVPSGYLFSVRANGLPGALRVALTDAAGKTIAQASSASGGAVSMPAPHVRVAATYYVIATIVQGSGERSVVRKIVVVPHGSRP